MGREAKEAINEARKVVGKCLNAAMPVNEKNDYAPGEILFTGGGSQADNLAIRGFMHGPSSKGRKHIITSKIEHHAVLYTCEALEKENVQAFGARRVVQEGAKYHGVWLETQPMGGEMYIKRDMDAGFNNILVFMENQRRDGRLPGMIRYDAPWNGLSAHFDWMQGDFFTVPALRMAWHIDRDRGYLERLYAALRDFDAVVVRSDYIPRIQEVQASVYHVLRRVVERRMA